MPATAIAPTPNALLPDKHRRTVQMNIRGKLKAALDLMVFGPADGDDAGEAMSFPDAARKVEFSVRAMRLALERPHVRAYLKAQKEVFRASASAQNISVLVKLRDEAGNGMVQLGAIKELERMDDIAASSSGPQARPGLVIVVVNSKGDVEQSLNSQHETAVMPVIEHVSTPSIREGRDDGA